MSQKEVIVVGGGLAGIRAALSLGQRGLKVSLLEKRAFLGGRAYSFQEKKTGSIVDNGQHLLMGAYSETLNLLQDLGSLDKIKPQDSLHVPYQSPKGQADLRAANLPHPLGLAWGFLSFPALKAKDKWKIAKLMRWIQKKAAKFPPRAHDKISVKRMLLESQQTERAIKVFWEPFTLATLNEKIETASSHRLIQTLQASLLKSKEASQLIFAGEGLSEVFGKPAEDILKKMGTKLFFQEQIKSLQKQKDQWEVQSQSGKKLLAPYLVLAIPPTSLVKVLEASSWQDPTLLEKLKKFKSSPILSINLWYKKLPDTKKFSALLDSPLQWVFTKAKVLHQSGRPYLSLVISADSDLTQKNKNWLVAMAQKELEKFFPQLKDIPLEHSQVIKEWEATYSGSTGLLSEAIPFQLAQGLFITGDWMHPDFPGTLESAVAMGQKTAELILKERDSSTEHT
ncbi:MAG: hydroxysqualene dehydroxylase HpnE [Deltaproteobacteria bacterium]|nr:hydroxysqualene dehydroxylase HpnE [Deltaproteobacteria bacterium]